MVSELKSGIDYLKSLFEEENIPTWLKNLIVKVIELDGKLEDSDLTFILSKFLEENDLKTKDEELNEPIFPSSFLENSDTQGLINFKSLTHVEGVNAIKEGEVLKFSPNLTIFFGRNGSGKSSYYRVFTKVTSKPCKNNILPNCIENQGEAFEKYNAILKTNDCDHVINPESKHTYLAEIFDQSFTDLLINPISHDLEIEPLKLYLITKLRKYLDDLGIKFSSELLRLKSSQKELKETLNSALIEIKGDISDEKYVIITNSIESGDLEVFDDESISNEILLEQKKEIKSVFLELDKIKNIINEIYAGDNFLMLLSEIKKQRKVVELSKEQYKSIKEYPYIDNPKWKQFMKSGKDFLSNVSELDKPEILSNCPFCEQELKNEGKYFNLVEQYMAFLTDDSQVKLNLLLKKKEDLLKQLLRVEGFEYLSLDKTRDDIKQEVSEFFDCFELVKEQIQIAEDSLPDLLNLKKLRNKLKVSIDSASVEIFSKRHFKDVKKLKKLSELLKKAGEISFQSYKTKISSLSKDAHNNIIQKPFVEKLRKNLLKLGSKQSADIVFSTSASGGEVKLIKKLHGHNVKEIMSDGEQRLLSFALFLTELEHKTVLRPIVLDDAVTSLDFEYLENIADEIVETSKKRQVIVFTHHEYFHDYLSDIASNALTEDQLQKNQIMFFEKRSGVKFSPRHETLNALLHIVIQCIYMQNGYKGDQAGYYLRKSIEAFIDETILCGQPMLIGRARTNPKKGQIRWELLENVLKNDYKLATVLHEYYDYVSDTDNHRTPRASDVNKLKEIYNFLDQYKTPNTAA